jgi:hypothetical protein
MDQSVTYRFGFDDYVALVRASRSLGPLGRLGRFGRIALFTVAVGTLAIAVSTFRDAAISNVVIYAILVYGLLFAAVALSDIVGEPLLLRYRYRRFAIADKEVTLRFGDDGVRAAFAGVESSIQWPSFKYFVATKDHIFLLLSRAEGLVVPLRAVADAAALGALASSIRSKIGSKIGNPPQS